MAMMIPVVALMLAVTAQVVLLLRDEMHLLHATRVAARAAVVDPEVGSVRGVLDDAGLARRGLEVKLSGSRRPGELVVVEVSAPPTRVPLVGAFVSRMELRERVVAMVE
jgi:hypothetical protein